MNLRRPLSVVTPTLDGDVLAALASADASMTGRQIQRRIGASQDGVRAVLERLTREGIVLREVAGPAYLFRLNRDHLAAPCIEFLATLRLRLIEKLRDAIAAWEVQPLAAVLFGSAARGDAAEASDLDILVVAPRGVDPDHPTWRDQLARLEASASAWTGNDARVVEYGVAELSRAREPVLDAAATEGVELAGSLRRLRRQFGRSHH